MKKPSILNIPNTITVMQDWCNLEEADIFSYPSEGCCK